MSLTAVSRADIVDELHYRLCSTRGGLRHFSKLAWPFIEPNTPLAWSWFHDAICDHLEAVTYGWIPKLLINIPPRHAKSTMTAIMWPCWEWGPAGQPFTRWIFSSYAQSLSTRDSQRRRYLMATRWYRSGWDHIFTLGHTKFIADAQIKYQNDKMGYHLSTSVGGSNTGEGGDRLVYDDPHNMNEIHSETVRDGVLRWRDEVMTTRMNDQRHGSEVLIMQRGHESDLSGHVLQKGGWVHLNLQAEYEPKRKCVTFTKDGTQLFEDPRTEPGELLFPALFPRSVIERLKLDLGPGYSAQFQQDCTPAEGGILKRAWWRYWVPMGHDLAGQPDENGRPILVLPSSFDQRIDSWDLAFKDKEDNDMVVGQAWGRNKALAYLIWQERGHFDFIESQFKVRALRKAHRQKPNAIYIEDKANGTAIMRTLRDDIPGILGVSPDESKEARAHAASPRLKAGNYVLPHPSLPGYEWVASRGLETDDPLPWVDGGFLARGSLLNELTMFPNAANDDQVDAFTQADLFLFLEDEFGEDHFAGSTEDHGF